MTPVDQLMGDVTITFKKRTMYSLVAAARITRALNHDAMVDDIEKTYAGNFSIFLARTDSITCKKNACQDAKDWAAFWNANCDRVDYVELFEDMLRALSTDVNLAWVTLFNRYEDNEVGRIDPDLGSPDRLPDEVLADPDIQKKDGRLEKSGVPTS